MHVPFLSAPTGTAFPNYLEMPARVPLAAWRVIRYIALAVLMGIIVALFVRPATTLAVFWGLAVPVLPLVFLIAPGSWRNVCPLAAANAPPHDACRHRVRRGQARGPCLRVHTLISRRRRDQINDRQNNLWRLTVQRGVNSRPIGRSILVKIQINSVTPYRQIHPQLCAHFKGAAGIDRQS